MYNKESGGSERYKSWRTRPVARRGTGAHAPPQGDTFSETKKKEKKETENERKKEKREKIDIKSNFCS